jgi:Domain of unknown function (DUF4157)
MQGVSRIPLAKSGPANDQKESFVKATSHPGQAPSPLLDWKYGAFQIQPKLSIGAVNHPMEREADAVADKVMRKCGTCTDEDEVKIARKPEHGNSAAVGPAPLVVHDVLRQSGTPLDPGTRAFFEPRFGRDFSSVRIHSGPLASESARAIQARAFTAGPNLVFGEHEFDPATASGRTLLAHELAHTVQQGSAEKLVQRKPDDDEMEVELYNENPEEIERLRNQGINLPTVSPETSKTLKTAPPPTTPFVLTDPYATTASAFPITVKYFKGTTDRRALIIGGVHNKTEPQGAAVVLKLQAILEARAKAGKPPFFTVILVPNLFDPKQYSTGDPRWIKGGQGRTKSGKLETSRAVEPNRNFPLPGEDLDTAHKRGAGSPKDAELVFNDPKTPGSTPREAHDNPGGAFSGTSTRMLPETRALIRLIESFHPERIASVHAHGLGSTPGDAPGIFVDPRGVDPSTGKVTNAAQGAEDDRLATALVTEGQKQLKSSPIAGAPSDPFKGNAPGTGKSTVRYTSGAHAEGNSLGTWAPVPVTSGSGARAGITTVTVEVPQWTGPSAPAQLGAIEDLDAKLLSEIFLEDPATATPSTGATTP